MNARAKVVALFLFSAGCATIPEPQWGVDRLEFEGVERVDPETLRVCLATHEREAVKLGLSALSEPKCGVPPFDKERASFRLWAWPWKDYPTYEEGVLKLDVQRVERWYQARGYYRAHVVKVEFQPAKMNEPVPCKEDCTGRIVVHVVEGEPVRLRSVKLEGNEGLDPALREDMLEVINEELAQNDIFDEAVYAKAREDVAKVLREAGYARAKVTGDVAVHRGLLYADATIRVEAGPVCTLGPVVIKSGSKIPEEPVVAAAKVERGARYSESALASAQHAVYGLNAFSSVTVRGDFEANPSSSEIPIIIEVSPRRESEPMIGAGIMSGVLSTGPLAGEGISVPQWDVHLLGSYAHRNFLGGLRQFRIEERPRLLFLGPFPSVPEDSPQFANSIQARFSQPGVIEARTSLFVESGWDYGPDPFLLFFRHDLTNAMGLEREFFEGRLQGRLAAHAEFMQVTRRQPIIGDDLDKGDMDMDGVDDRECQWPLPLNEEREACLPASYRLPYLEQRVIVDLRDNGTTPTKGGYFSMGAHEALPVGERSWFYLRLTPDLRGYAPLGLGFVLAGRFTIGSLHIFDAGDKLDEEASALGPQAYRLRGGGANGNRGFAPGGLGDGVTGGTSKWESSIELRIPLAKNFSLAGFADAGDVYAPRCDPSPTAKERMEAETRGESPAPSCDRQRVAFRFNHLNTAVGGGLRYRTIVGPIRLDVGYRPSKLQRADGSASDAPEAKSFGLKFNGAIHLTIGESF
jgi:translocation and assembly module TamA